MKENESQNLSTKSKGAIKERKYVINKDSKCVCATNDSTFVTAMTFAQSEIADNEWDFSKESSRNNGDHVNSSRESINKIHFNKEMNSINLWYDANRIKAIKLHEGATVSEGDSFIIIQLI